MSFYGFKKKIEIYGKTFREAIYNYVTWKEVENKLMDQYQQFIHKSRYARWIPEENRRETWPETVQRYVDFLGTTWTDRRCRVEETV